MLTTYENSAFLRSARWIITLTAFVAIAATGKAQPVGFPQIMYDTRQGPGQNIYGPQGVHYTAGIGWTVSARALSITYDGINFIPLVHGTVDLHAAFINSTVVGQTVIGNFTGVGGPLPDLIVADETGVLLGTNYWNRTIRGDFFATGGTTDSRFTVVSGSLAPFYTSWQNIGSNTGTLFNVNPAFSANTFTMNFDADMAGVIGPGPVPAPTATMLICTSVLAIARRRRH